MKGLIPAPAGRRSLRAARVVTACVTLSSAP